MSLTSDAAASLSSVAISSAAASCSATDMRWACSDSHDRVDQLASSSCCRFEG